jgi:hypothetical protein
VVAKPLTVVARLNEPQAPVPVLPQVTDQATPSFVASLVTTAVRDNVAPTIREAGGVPMNVIEIGSTGIVW